MLPVLWLTLPVAARAQFTFTTNNGAIIITGYAGPGGDVTIPDWTNGYPVTGIGDWAFLFGTSLTNVTIPDNVTNLGDYAFYYCANLTNVTLPNNANRIGNGAFYDCTSLPGVSIPDGVTELGDAAFAWCGSLTSVAFGNGVTRIGNEAFDSCSSLTSLTIPGSVTHIGDEAFAWCGGLTNVTIGNSVTNLGDYAFAGCALTSVTIPESVARIGVQAFGDCTSLAAITVDTNNSTYSSVDGVLLDKGRTTLLEYPAGVEGSYTIPNTVTNLADYAFAGCALTSAAIPNSVTRIGSAAFAGTSLTSVTIPNSITRIGADAFAWCYSLTNATIGTGVNSIGSEAFHGCSSLVAITVDSSNAAYCSVDGVLYDKGTNVLIACPEGKVGSLTIPDSVTGIGSNALRSCRSLTNVTIGNRVTNIAMDAFSSGSSLTSVTIGDSVTNLGYYAFYYCTSLLSVYFEGDAPGVGYSPFMGDNSATVYYLPGTAGWTNTFAGRPAVLWNPFPPAPGALVHRYSFSETGGTTVADSVGGSSWNGALPNGGTFSGGQLTLASNASQYVSLPAGIVSTLGSFTIEVWVKLNSAGNGARFFDFGDNTTNYMLLTPQSGSTGKLRFAIRNPDNSDQEINGPNALSTGVWHHVAVTLSGNTGVLYLNGAAVGTNSAMTLKPSSLGSTTRNWLGRSEFSNPYLNGVLDEFRIYSGALSPAEIAATDVLGPSMTLSTNSPQMHLAVTDENLTLSWPLECAGFVLQSCTDLALADWQTVTSPAPQIVGNQWQVSLPVPISNLSTFYRLLK